MPQGKGTYGSKVGRPPKKNKRKLYNKGTRYEVKLNELEFEKQNEIHAAVSSFIDSQEKYRGKISAKELLQEQKDFKRNINLSFSIPISTIESLIGGEITRRSEEKQRKEIEISQQMEALSNRTDRVPKVEGGSSLLNDDRERYSEGKDVKKTITLDTILFKDDKEKKVSVRDALERSRPDSVYAYMQSGNKDWLFSKSYGDEGGNEYQSGQMPESVGKRRLEILQSLFNAKDVLPEALPIGTRTKKAKGGEMEDQMNALAISVAPARVEEQETHTMPDGTVMPGATHEEYEQMLPDEKMEEDYVDFVVSSTLEEEDKNYLESALAEDAKLSEIFDQVVESASEFSGSGPVEGLGSGVSDSIPARLSDGEFVFTAKATDEIGADNLQRMMEDAEAGADERQGVVHGGMVEDEGDPKAVPIQTRGSVVAQGNIPNVAKQSRQVEEEMLKSSPRRYYVPVSG